jgi:hypothetical protein
MTGAPTLFDSSRLLRLHRAGPERDGFGDAEEGIEASAFLDWLKSSHAEVAVVKKLDRVEDVEAFLQATRKVRNSGRVSAGRQEDRIPNSVQVLLNIAECETDLGQVGSPTIGHTIDLCPHGLCVFNQQELPTDAVLRLTITAVGFPIAIYNLVGDPRWAASDDEGQRMGIQILEAQDFSRWEREFPRRFVR